MIPGVHRHGQRDDPSQMILRAQPGGDGTSREQDPLQSADITATKTPKPGKNTKPPSPDCCRHLTDVSTDAPCLKTPPTKCAYILRMSPHILVTGATGHTAARWSRNCGEHLLPDSRHEPQSALRQSAGGRRNRAR